jgi:hypothetical protein
MLLELHDADVTVAGLDQFGANAAVMISRNR